MGVHRRHMDFLKKNERKTLPMHSHILCILLKHYLNNPTV